MALGCYVASILLERSLRLQAGFYELDVSATFNSSHFDNHSRTLFRISDDQINTLCI